VSVAVGIYFVRVSVNSFTSLKFSRKNLPLKRNTVLAFVGKLSNVSLSIFPLDQSERSSVYSMASTCLNGGDVSTCARYFWHISKSDKGSNAVVGVEVGEEVSSDDSVRLDVVAV